MPATLERIQQDFSIFYATYDKMIQFTTLGYEVNQLLTSIGAAALTEAISNVEYSDYILYGSTNE